MLFDAVCYPWLPAFSSVVPVQGICLASEGNEAEYRILSASAPAPPPPLPPAQQAGDGRKDGLADILINSGIASLAGGCRFFLSELVEQKSSVSVVG